ncbi:uncharacterized protein [Nicotiana sylvestris]
MHSVSENTLSSHVSKRILTMSYSTPCKLITRGLAKNMVLEKRTKSCHDRFKETQVEKSLKETRLPIAKKREKHISEASSVKRKEVEASKSSDTLEEKGIKLFVKNNLYLHRISVYILTQR